jgi:hypothetical protein
MNKDSYDNHYDKLPVVEVTKLDDADTAKCTKCSGLLTLKMSLYRGRMCVDCGKHHRIVSGIWEEYQSSWKSRDYPDIVVYRAITRDEEHRWGATLRLIADTSEEARKAAEDFAGVNKKA